MRLSKPATGGGLSYKVYPNIALRNEALESLKDGQEVKVLDATDDSNISSGWAIYKYSKESNLFDLLEKEEDRASKYKIYPDITARYKDSINLSHGQEVKVLNAEDDPNISSGWAIYKYDKKSHSFNLLEKQEKPKVLATDERTVNKIDLNGNDTLMSPELMHPYCDDIRILQDFDYSVEVDAANKKLVFKVNGGTDPIAVPLQTPVGTKYIHILPMKIPQSAIPPTLAGKPMYWGIYACIRDTAEDVPKNMQRSIFPDGRPQILTPRDVVTDAIFPLMQVRFDVPLRSTWTWYGRDLTVIKYWEKILAPAEERIVIPEQQAVYKIYDSITERDADRNNLLDGQEVKILSAKGDSLVYKGWAIYKYRQSGKVFDLISQEFPVIEDDYTISKVILSEREKYIVPALQIAHRHDIKILEDFDYEIELGLNNASVIFRPNKIKCIPIMIGSTKKYISITTESFLLNYLPNSGKGHWQHIKLTASIKDDDTQVVGMGTSHYDNGAVLPIKPSYPNPDLTILMLKLYIPNDEQTWDENNFFVYKYWRNALGSFDELLQNYNQRNP